MERGPSRLEAVVVGQVTSTRPDCGGRATRPDCGGRAGHLHQARLRWEGRSPPPGQTAAVGQVTSTRPDCGGRTGHLHQARLWR